MKMTLLTLLLALATLVSPVVADEQTAFKEGYRLGKIYSVADGVRLTPSEIRDTAETKAYRNGYPNEGKERTSFIKGWIKGYSETHP
jgi:hypothetical protein